MTYPSIKTLEHAFPGKGAELRALIDGTTAPDTYASVREWVAQCYHAPRRHEQVECALNEVLEGFGTEAVPPSFINRPDATYINMGDTYTATLLYDHTRDKWVVTSWGDWVELQERRGVHYD